jgi:hypothetical protein
VKSRPLGQLRNKLAATLLLALLLIAGLCATPSVASQQDFGHDHQDHEPEHVHDIDVTLRNPILTERVTCVLTLLEPVGDVPPLEEERAVFPLQAAANPIRAPPGAPVTG